MRLPARLPWLALMAFLALVPLAVAQTEAPQPDESEELFDEPREGRFVYFRSGALITLQASPLHAATLAPHAFAHKGPLTPPDGLELDPRGARPDLIERGVTLFRVPTSLAPRGLDTSPPVDAWQVAFASGLPAQPVFEHGAALRIPSDEVVVAFDPATTLADAKRLLSGTWDDLDARLLQEFRPGIFICLLRESSNGRAFEVSRLLTKVEGVVWAEPSFINVHLETPGGPPAGQPQFSQRLSMTHQQKLQSKYINRMLPTTHRDPEGNAWRVGIDGHFEFDIDRWIVARDEGSNRVLPEVVRDRTHEGQRAVYMSGKGLAANEPPDPYLEGVSSYLMSPIFGLAGSREVFIELWFWAQFEDPVDAPRRVHDLGRVLLFDVEERRYVYEYPIVPIGSSGDLTRGAGTDRGWRKLMFRLPVQKLGRSLQLRVHFYSDGVGGSGGLYVDDIRVIYGAGDGGNSFTRAPDALHQYAITPRGQIAGWPSRGDPAVDAAAAWTVGATEKKVIVALLDDGVERDHPDLAFWDPENDEEDGSEDSEPPTVDDLPPGEPLSPDDRHGTACAGVLGAVSNNGIGIAGVAPGALLLPLHRGIDDLSIVRAIDAAVEYDAHVLVIPWGWSGAAPTVITRAIIDAIDAGTTVVAAAGDGVHRPYSDTVDYPCLLSASTSLICVGASGIAGEPKGWASMDGLYWWRSAEDEVGPDLLAPGTWLHATERRGRLGYNDGSQDVPSEWTDEFAGTGASACYVGGVATLMASHDPLMRPEELKRSIVETAMQLPPTTGRRSELRLVVPKEAVLAAIESAAARVD
jgi:hypothetical protein